MPQREKAQLTPEEVQVLTLISKGATTQEVADDLGISRYAVKKRVDSVLEKLRGPAPPHPPPPLRA
jgi:DNA-binding NarL/FixJ family response regulator